MRAHTAAEAAILDGRHYQVHVRVDLQDATGAWRRLTGGVGGDPELGPGSWVLGATWGADADQPVGQGTLTLRRSRSLPGVAGPVSLAALMRTGGAAGVPIVETGHGVRIATAVTAPGLAPLESQWRNVYAGRIADHDAGGVRWGGDADTITCQLADPVAALARAQVEDPRVYGSDAGTPLETVVRAVLADWMQQAPGGVPALDVPQPLAWAVPRYEQQPQSVLEAVTALAAQRGAQVRGRWTGAAGAAGAFVLALTLPRRASDVAAALAAGTLAPDLVIPPSRVLALPRLVTSDAEVRNVVRAVGTDAAGQPITATAVRQASVDRVGVGRQFMQLAAEATRNLRTVAELQRLADYAADDLSDPPVSHDAEIRYDWRVEVGDLIRFGANGRTYRQDQILAVVGYTHALSRAGFRTTLRCAGTPRGSRAQWLRADDRVTDAAASQEDPVRLVLTPASTPEQTTVVARTVPPGGTVQLVSATAVRLAGPAPGVAAPDNTAWVFARPAPAGGAVAGDDVSATFRATEPGGGAAGSAPDEDAVTVPGQGRDTVPLLLTARRIAADANTVTVRVSVSRPYVEQSATLTLASTAGAGGPVTTAGGNPAPEGGAWPILASTAPGDERAGYARDFTIPRPAENQPPARVAFRAAAAGCVPDVDTVDVPARDVLGVGARDAANAIAPNVGPGGSFGGNVTGNVTGFVSGNVGGRTAADVAAATTTVGGSFDGAGNLAVPGWLQALYARFVQGGQTRGFAYGDGGGVGFLDAAANWLLRLVSPAAGGTDAGRLHGPNSRAFVFEPQVWCASRIVMLNTQSVTYDVRAAGGWAQGAFWKFEGTEAHIAGSGLYGTGATPQWWYASADPGGNPWAGTGIRVHPNGVFQVITPGAERFRVDGSGARTLGTMVATEFARDDGSRIGRRLYGFGPPTQAAAEGDEYLELLS